MITDTITAFNLEYIESGHLVLLFNNQNRLLGSGVVTEVEPLEVRALVHFRPERDIQNFGDHNTRSRLYNNEIDMYPGDLIPYTIEIGQVNSGELQIFIIDPSAYIIGNENAPVSY